MPTIAELAEQPNDWFAELGLVLRNRDDADRAVAQVEDRQERPPSLGSTGYEERGSGTGSFTGRPRAMARPPRISGIDRIRNELHDLLCGGVQYEEERTKFTEQFKLGQVGFATSVSTILVPVLGQAAPVVGVVVGVSLTAIGKVGLNVWCEGESERKAKYDAAMQQYNQAIAAPERTDSAAQPVDARRREGRHRSDGS